MTVSAADETKDENFASAMRCIGEDRCDDAIGHLHAVVESRHTSPESSFFLGSLYLDKKNDPISAMYFLQKCIDESVNVDRTRAKMAERLMDSAKKKFLKSFPAYNGVSQSESELVEIARALQVQNSMLRGQIASYRQKVSELEARAEALASSMKNGTLARDANTGAMMHVVQPGETLSSISSRYYGTPNLWQKILDANRSALDNPRTLHPGQTLTIP
jgi:nucleoid-associated protein YgaU